MNRLLCTVFAVTALFSVTACKTDVATRYEAAPAGYYYGQYYGNYQQQASQVSAQRPVQQQVPVVSNAPSQVNYNYQAIPVQPQGQYQAGQQYRAVPQNNMEDMSVFHSFQ